VADSHPGLDIIDLGRMGYAQALEIQRARQAELIDARGVPGGPIGTIYLVEHEPVITVTSRPGAAEHVLASIDHLASLGVELHQTDRGGDVTYHGPGQIVAYPILDLERLSAPSGKPLGLHGYMRLLEQAVIDTLATYDISGERDETATGVWVSPGMGPPAKIAAMGVRVRKWVTMHGLALNVSPDLAHFNLIVPCGLAGRPVTSMHAILGESCPGFSAARTTLAGHLARLVTEHAASPISR
jgi:lipoyl(octanoyl) transferase